MSKGHLLLQTRTKPVLILALLAFLALLLLLLPPLNAVVMRVQCLEARLHSGRSGSSSSSIRLHR